MDNPTESAFYFILFLRRRSLPTPPQTGPVKDAQRGKKLFSTIERVSLAVNCSSPPCIVSITARCLDMQRVELTIYGLSTGGIE